MSNRSFLLYLKKIYKFEALQPVKKKVEKKPAEARPKKIPRILVAEGSEAADDDGRRKSARISGKVHTSFKKSNFTF